MWGWFTTIQSVMYRRRASLQGVRLFKGMATKQWPQNPNPRTIEHWCDLPFLNMWWHCWWMFVTVKHPHAYGKPLHSFGESVLKCELPPYQWICLTWVNFPKPYFYIFFYWHNNFIIWMSHHGIISFKVEKNNWTICSWGLKQSYMWLTCLKEVNYLPSCHLEKQCFHFGLCAWCEFMLKTKTWFPSDFCISVWQRLLEMVEPMEMVECITWHYY
jgi:hypothetical protein